MGDEVHPRWPPGLSDGDIAGVREAAEEEAGRGRNWADGGRRFINPSGVSGSWTAGEL